MPRIGRRKLARKISTIPSAPLLKKAALYRGLYARVARELGRELSHVRRVALGQRRSPEIEAAILREAERIERESAA